MHVYTSLCMSDSGQDHSQTLFYYFIYAQTHKLSTAVQKKTNKSSRDDSLQVDIPTSFMKSLTD